MILSSLPNEKQIPKFCKHAGSIEVERAVHTIEGDEEHEDDKDAQGVEEGSLFPPEVGGNGDVEDKDAIWNQEKEMHDKDESNKQSGTAYLWIKLPFCLPFAEVTKITSWTW